MHMIHFLCNPQLTTRWAEAHSSNIASEWLRVMAFLQGASAMAYHCDAPDYEMIMDVDFLFGLAYYRLLEIQPL